MKPARFTALSVASATALITFAGIFAATPSFAEELLLPVVGCPATVGAVGYPVASPRIAESGVHVTVSTGALPGDLHLTEGPEGSFVTGKPSTAGTYTFTIHGVATAPDGTTEAADKSCTITVRSAPKVTRIAGTDRYAQAVAVAEAHFTHPKIVYVASGEKYPDALSATAVAANHGSPLLLTPNASMPPAVVAEIVKLDPEQIVVVGGEASVSAAVITQLAAASEAHVTRIGGADRYAVSRNLIAHPDFGIATSDKVFIATGATFPDALTASPAAASTGAPVLLVNGTETALTPDEHTLLSGLGVTSAFIAGGPASVSGGLETKLKAEFTTVRFSGLDRFDVGHAINQASFASTKTMYLASGVAFPDALSGGVLAGVADSPLYVTQSCVSDQLWREIGRLAPENVVILGGTATLGAGLDTLKPCTLD